MGQRKGQYIDLARDLSTHFKHWLAALKVTTFNDVCHLEQFKNYFPECIVAYCMSLSEIDIVAGATSLEDECSMYA